nr:MAG TPA: hypothetical protein [Caudoviricetes sp.]DAP54856.1 MAG TPA: hypothetical protein [Caudoviricetes sp.]
MSKILSRRISTLPKQILAKFVMLFQLIHT